MLTLKMGLKEAVYDDDDTKRDVIPLNFHCSYLCSWSIRLCMVFLHYSWNISPSALKTTNTFTEYS